MGWNLLTDKMEDKVVYDGPKMMLRGVVRCNHLPGIKFRTVNELGSTDSSNRTFEFNSPSELLNIHITIRMMRKAEILPKFLIR
jgi:hypothetical protein